MRRTLRVHAEHELILESHFDIDETAAVLRKRLTLKKTSMKTHRYKQDTTRKETDVDREQLEL